MKKIIAGVCTNLLITQLAIAENRLESIDITKEYEVPFSDNNLGEEEDFYNSYTTTETFAGRSQIIKKVYLSFISNKTASNFYSQAPPIFS